MLRREWYKLHLQCTTSMTRLLTEGGTPLLAMQRYAPMCSRDTFTRCSTAPFTDESIKKSINIHQLYTRQGQKYYYLISSWKWNLCLPRSSESRSAPKRIGKKRRLFFFLKWQYKELFLHSMQNYYIIIIILFSEAMEAYPYHLKNSCHKKIFTLI